jgi:pyrroline-5-carboxylate reductase
VGYLFIEALADGGVLAGLPRDKAMRYALQTVLGSASMIQETGKHPGELKDMVCSPGGTTIAAVAALEENAFRGTVIKAVEAAWRRSLEMA